MEVREELDPEKLVKLHNTNELLDRKYGKRGTQERENFNKKALAWYYEELLGDTKENTIPVSTMGNHAKKTKACIFSE
jgi:hypothetical protein